MPAKTGKPTVVIFDDKWSFLHFLVGTISGFFGYHIIWLLYIMYELIEFVRKRDTIAGDAFEFMLGYGFGAMIAHTCTM